MKDQLIKTVFYHKAIHTYNEVHTNTTISILYTSTHISNLKMWWLNTHLFYETVDLICLMHCSTR